MKRPLKKALFILFDMIGAAAAMLAAYYLRFAGEIPEKNWEMIPIHCLIAVVSFLIFSLCFGTYSSLLDYIGFSDAFLELSAVAGSVIAFLVLRFFKLLEVSGSISVIYGVLLFLAACAVRLVPRFRRWCESRYAAGRGNTKRVVIVGGGVTGSMLIKRLRSSIEDGMYPVAVVDDDPHKIGMKLEGIPVCGNIDNLAKCTAKYNADEIIVAIPTADGGLISRVNEQGKKCGKPVRILANVTGLDSASMGQKLKLKEISIEDLLFRDVVKPDMKPVKDYLRDKVVMVTGGCGSIGSELCRQVLGYGCRLLIIFDIDENGLFYLNEELKQRFDRSRYELCVGSIRDKQRISCVMGKYHPEIVLHAAAHKHVPMMEINPFEAVKNNIGGTKNLLECCTEYGVKKFLQISTDKAVNPTNVMGATKRVTELLVQMMNGKNGCEMVAVRFGNVLGSNGSVIPTFKRQIAEGGPVTVTDPEMKRYFMTIPEAVSLVLTAEAQARGGELFVLDMGKPVKIVDLAKDLIELSGLEVDKDIKIVFTGLRPGEKLFEELALNTEEVDKTSHKKIFVMHSQIYDESYISTQIAEILQLAGDEEKEQQLRETLFGFINSSNLEQHLSACKAPELASAGSR